MEIAGLIIALIALIPIAYFLWDRYARKPHKFEIDSQNALFARFICPNNKKNGYIGLAVYVLKILNSSKESLTVKQVLLRYSVKGVERFTDSHVLLTGTIYDPHKKKNVNAIIVKIGTNNVVLMNWNNLRTEIGKYKVLSPGEVLSGSALFVLDIVNQEQISDLENIKVVVVNYRGKKTEHSISIKDEWLTSLRNGAVIENRSFIKNQNGQIVFI